MNLPSKLPVLLRDSFISKLNALVLLCILSVALPATALDLRDAAIVCPPTLSPVEKKAVLMLEEEVQKRTQIRWPETTSWPTNQVVVAVGPVSKLAEFAGPFARDSKSFGSSSGAEGYRLCLRKNDGQSAVFVIGDDARGVLFGVGRLLRELHMQRGSLTLADDLDIQPPRPSIRCAVINSATGPRRIPTTPGTCPFGSNTSATSPSSAATPSS